MWDPVTETVFVADTVLFEESEFGINELKHKITALGGNVHVTDRSEVSYQEENETETEAEEDNKAEEES